MIKVCDIDTFTGTRDNLERYQSAEDAYLVSQKRVKGWQEGNDLIVEHWGYMDKSQRPGIVMMVECADGEVCDYGIQIIGERP